MKKSQWNLLSDYFDTYQSKTEQGVMANIDQTWKVLAPYAEITNKYLDYGCGTGRLCNKMNSMGLDVTGFDTAETMVEIAKLNSPQEITYISGEPEIIFQDECKFDLITSMMVFQFVENISETIEKLYQKLTPNGILWFSVHNEKYVFDQITKTPKFVKKNGKVTPKEAFLVLREQEIAAYLRNSDEYNNICSKIGLTKLLEFYSDDHKENIPSKYMVMAFQKIAKH